MPEITAANGERVATRRVGQLIADQTGAGRVERLARLPEQIALRQIVAAYADTAERPTH